MHKLLIFIVVLLFTSTIQAQRHEEAFDEDYDSYDYTENNYNNDYYERYSEAEYKRRNERFYKKSYREEDLYNGGYRNRDYSDNTANSAGLGGWSLFNFNKKSTNEATNDRPDNEPKKFNRYDGIEKGVGEAYNPEGNIFNENPTNYEPGKGQEKPGDDDANAPPPPPIIPDVPVKSTGATIILIVSIVSFLRYKKL